MLILYIAIMAIFVLKNKQAKRLDNIDDLAGSNKEGAEGVCAESTSVNASEVENESEEEKMEQEKTKKTRVKNWHIICAIVLLLGVGAAITFGLPQSSDDTKIAKAIPAEQWNPLDAYEGARELSENRHENQDYTDQARQIRMRYKRSPRKGWTALTGGGTSGIEQVRHRDGSVEFREEKNELRLLQRTNFQANKPANLSLRRRVQNGTVTAYNRILR